jgi:hypothetical protein
VSGGGFSSPGKGFWQIDLTSDQRWPADDCEPNLRARLLARLDCLIAQGIGREPAIRLLEDELALPRGSFERYTA